MDWNLELGTLLLGKPECFSNVGQNSGTLELWNLAGKANFKLLAWNLELGTLVLGKPKYFSNVGQNSGTLELWNLVLTLKFLSVV